MLGICLQLARPLSPLPDHIGKLQIPVAAVPVSAYVSLVVFVFAFGLMALFYWRPSLGRKFVEKTLAGSVSPLVAYLGRARKLSDQELADLQRLVDELKAEREETDR